jgi:penicillin-binding protein-related factor A (putative recombinase)
MALEYDLSFDGIDDIYPVLEFEFAFDKNVFESQKYDKLITIDLYKSYGFLFQIYTGANDNRYLQYQNLLNVNEEREVNEGTRVSFRLDKTFDNIKAKRNVVNFCIKILKRTTRDAFLIFNGDYLTFERVNGILIINKKMDFWKYMNFDFEGQLEGIEVKYI